MQTTIARPEAGSAVPATVEQAFALYDQGRPQDALGVLESILCRQPQSFDALFGAGVVQHRLGALPESIAWFTRALAVAPGDLNCRLNLVGLHLQRGAVEPARELVVLGLKLAPDQPDLLRFRAWLARRDKLQDMPLAIVSFADLLHANAAVRQLDGDHWFARHLTQALQAQGAVIDAQHARALLLLHGRMPTQVNATYQKLYRMVWIHSHPDWLTPAALADFDHVFCISPRYTRTLQAQGVAAEPLIGGTLHSPPAAPVPLQHGLVFVGNTRAGGAIRPIIRDLLALGPKWQRRLEVWGRGWRGLIPDECVRGDCVPNHELPALYAGSVAVLNDHHEDMRREGFLNPRILDVMAAGGVVVSDDLADAGALFGQALLAYRTPQDLDGLLTRLFEDPAWRATCRQRGAAAVAPYRFDQVAARIIDHLVSVDEDLLARRAKQHYMETVWAPVKGKLDTGRIQNLKRATAEQCAGRTLDIGCANGDSTALMKQHRPDLELTGIELTEWGCRAAAQNHPELRVVQGDAACLPFPDQSFDTAVLDHVIEHHADPVPLLWEARRVARARVVVGIPVMHLDDPDHKVAWSVEDFRRLLEGFFPRVSLRGLREPDGVEVWDPQQFNFVVGTGYLAPGDRKELAGAPPWNLHLGCGKNRLAGFVNIDVIATPATDLVCDARRLPLVAGSVARIETYHMIEHLSRHGFVEALFEWNRVLTEGGDLVIECPDFEATVRDYVAGRKFRINNIFGLQRHPGDFHRFGYDAATLQELLEMTGFGGCVAEAPTDYHAADEPSLRVRAVKTRTARRPPALRAWLVQRAQRQYAADLARCKAPAMADGPASQMWKQRPPGSG